MFAHKKSPFYCVQKNVMIRLLAGYKENRCLWKATHRNYRNNEAKSSAWDRLLTIYREYDPSATRGIVKEKIYQIRQTYVRLRKRSLEEASFVPKLWCYRYLNFLASQVRPKLKKKPVPVTNDSEEDESTKFNETLNNLLKFLPFEQRPLARTFITEITYRAKNHHMGVLKLSMSVGDNDVILIPNSEPMISMYRPSYKGVTSRDLERMDIEETQNAVNNLRFDSNEPEDTSNAGSAVIVINADDG